MRLTTASVKTLKMLNLFIYTLYSLNSGTYIYGCYFVKVVKLKKFEGTGKFLRLFHCDGTRKGFMKSFNKE